MIAAFIVTFFTWIAGMDWGSIINSVMSFIVQTAFTLFLIFAGFWLLKTWLRNKFRRW
jgi:hypothetical protein